MEALDAVSYVAAIAGTALTTVLGVKGYRSFSSKNEKKPDIPNTSTSSAVMATMSQEETINALRTSDIYKQLEMAIQPKSKVEHIMDGAEQFPPPPTVAVEPEPAPTGRSMQTKRASSKAKTQPAKAPSLKPANATTHNKQRDRLLQQISILLMMSKKKPADFEFVVSGIQSTYTSSAANLDMTTENVGELCYLGTGDSKSGNKIVGVYLFNESSNPQLHIWFFTKISGVWFEFPQKPIYEKMDASVFDRLSQKLDNFM